ncbi:RcpC/CpaB family pilus assembly protein [Aliagarivorans taiwanensis]|uniref:RcpC/CpaB family pilus assembly protein n=1 Tax=Aliagarivorans taiwanensis TaxID=561966 RepID=UPI0003F51274|nr:RcpC/CpaB family pilus assembly protein [Aliagarivorans taiwanensis]
MNSKLVFFFALCSLLLGVFGLVGQLTSKSMASVDNTDWQQLAPEAEEIKVRLWRAKRGLGKGEVFELAMVEAVVLDREQANEAGFTEDVLLSPRVGGRLNQDIEEGDWVDQWQITQAGEKGFLSLITTPGKTLYPLNVSTRNQVKDYMNAGDYIDVIAIGSPQRNLSNDLAQIDQYQGVIATKLLSDALLVSITFGEMQGSDADPINVANSDLEATLVIEVEPQDVGRLALAQRSMHIEAYPSDQGIMDNDVALRDVIKNYDGVIELRGDGYGGSL